MCGICGIVSRQPVDLVEGRAVKGMNDALRHRGPDDEGYYTDDFALLAVRRLSIIDLISGHQPISNEDGTVWLVFNGEIYNFRALRRQLEQKGHFFSTETDSEVIVHSYEEYGDECVHRFNGMFAFAIWDLVNRRLLLARDRLGIKPLYYWQSQDKLVFGSELKAIIAHPAVPLAVDLEALDLFLALEYIPAPHSILKQVHKLPPGHRLIFDHLETRLEQYWEIPLRETSFDENGCTEALAELLDDAVRIRLMSDVPIGAFLSGGIDSSTVVSFMSEAIDEPVKTFSIGFADPTYNELHSARLVAKQFHTNHHEAILEPDIVGLTERLISHLDEPLADFSLFPTYLVSQLASQHVKVVLTGDGGDEIFGGYETYAAQQWDRYYRRLPAIIRHRTLPRLLDLVPPQPAKKGIINKTKRYVEGASLSPALQHTRWMIFMTERDRASLYSQELRVTLNGRKAEGYLRELFQSAAQFDPLGQQQFVDLKGYLANDILTKVDRMSMAVSIEARVPMLDYRIVEFMINLPSHLKLRRGQTKVLLRRAVADRLPRQVLSKPKEGFSIPLKHWLRGPLRPLMTDLLSLQTLNRRGYFDAACVHRWLSEHLEQRANHSHRLWALMVFELWLQQTLDRKPVTAVRTG